jgi:hypothetical protein
VNKLANPIAKNQHPTPHFADIHMTYTVKEDQSKEKSQNKFDATTLKGHNCPNHI